MFGMFNVNKEIQDTMDRIDFDGCVTSIFCAKALDVLNERGEGSSLSSDEVEEIRGQAAKHVEESVSQMERGWNMTRGNALRQFARDNRLKVN